MGITRQCVFRYLQQLRFAPSSIASLALEYLGIARIVRIVGTAGQVHGLAVRRETACAFVVLAVQFRFDGFRCLPLVLLVFLGHEDVACLHARDATHLVALCLWTRRSQEQLVPLIAVEHGREVGTSRVEERFFLYRVQGRLLLPYLGLCASLQTFDGTWVVGHTVEEQLIVLRSILVIALLVLHLRQIEDSHRVGILVSDGILIGTYGLGGEVDMTIAFGHLPCPLASLRFVLHSRAAIALLVFGSSIEVFPNGKVSITLLDVRLGTTAGEHQEECQQIQSYERSPFHTLII